MSQQVAVTVSIQETPTKRLRSNKSVWVFVYSDIVQVTTHTNITPYQETQLRDNLEPNEPLEDAERDMYALALKSFDDWE